jgi:putative phage-type endonuclease
MAKSAIVNREAWLAERKQGIGGSDVASVFNTEFGCKLRLWRDKRNEEPDFPSEENDVMQIGTLLEDFFARKYAKQTRSIVVRRKRPAVHKQYPWMRVNVDRMIHLDINGQDKGKPGVLEIKSVGLGQFYKVKREGLPEAYLFQMQHAMEVIGTNWGAFAIGCRENGRLEHWRVEKDKVLAQVIVAEEAAFWKQVESGEMPARLDPADSRCQRCEYRRSCQGDALVELMPERNGEIERDNRLFPILNELIGRKELLKQAEQLVNESEEVLKTELADRQAVEVEDGQGNINKVYWRPQDNRRGDFKTLDRCASSPPTANREIQLCYR